MIPTFNGNSGFPCESLGTFGMLKLFDTTVCAFSRFGLVWRWISEGRGPSSWLGMMLRVLVLVLWVVLVLGEGGG